MKRVAINGFGRVGKMVLRALCARGVPGETISVAAIADFPDDARYYAYQLKHDSVHRRLDASVHSGKSETCGEKDDMIVLNGSSIRIIPAVQDAALLPWKDHEIDIVLDATGLCVTFEDASRHLKAGAKKVIVSNITGDPGVKTIIGGVNDNNYDRERHHVLSGASCTTNCIVPVIHALEKSGIPVESGHMAVLLPFTASRKIVDAYSPRGLRDGRSAAMNIIPSTAKTSTVIDEFFPSLKGRIGEVALRVPVAEASLLDFSFVTQRDSSFAAVDEALRSASATYLKDIVGTSDEELVSTDVIGEARSSLYDSPLSLRANMKNEKRLFRLFLWFDNEWGYANRIVDLMLKV
ncbi:MAG: type I glyceraldehyde-3-phosphate dehydrogenase [Spirochaetes bacterium]|nr:type I glyceraldehyde-3-phosphate dehydrogenase [Spirochaetota bacterium]